LNQTHLRTIEKLRAIEDKIEEKEVLLRKFKSFILSKQKIKQEYIENVARLKDFDETKELSM